MKYDGASLHALTERIIGAAFEVSNTLGAGFLEKVYENALVQELRVLGLDVTQQRGVAVRYKDIVELKVAQSLNDFHTAQCVNYLRATGKTTSLLMNFAKPRLEFRRIVR